MPPSLVKMIILVGLILGLAILFFSADDPLKSSTVYIGSKKDTNRDELASSTTSELQVPSQKDSLAEPPPESHADEISNTLTQLFKEERYAEALAHATRYAEDPELSNTLRQWLKRQIPSIITSYGWQKYQQTDYFVAIALFEKALEIQNEPLAIKGLAGAYFQLKYLWQAEHYSRLFLQQEPKDFDTSMLLIETLESTQNLLGAMDVLSNLQKTGELNQAQKAFTRQRVDTIRARLKESHHQSTISSSHFILTYRQTEHDPMVTWLLELLENTLDEFRMDWGFDEPKAPVEIILYPAQSFSQMIHGPEWAQAIYDGRIRIPIDSSRRLDHQNLERIVRHELVHALTAQQTGHRPLPPWFSEGIAQFLECPGGCRMDRSTWQSGGFLSQELFQKSFLDLPRDQARRAYSQSLFMIQTLVQMKGGLAIVKTLEALGPSAVLDSNQILSPLDLKFAGLYATSVTSWQKTSL